MTANATNAGTLMLVCMDIKIRGFSGVGDRMHNYFDIKEYFTHACLQLWLP